MNLGSVFTCPVCVASRHFQYNPVFPPSTPGAAERNPARWQACEAHAHAQTHGFTGPSASLRGLLISQ